VTFPRTAQESPRLAMKRVFRCTMPTRQHDPTAARTGLSCHWRDTSVMNPWSVARNAFLIAPTVIPSGQMQPLHRSNVINPYCLHVYAARVNMVASWVSPPRLGRRLPQANWAASGPPWPSKTPMTVPMGRPDSTQQWSSSKLLACVTASDRSPSW
jgi:hypothetical protein